MSAPQPNWRVAQALLAIALVAVGVRAAGLLGPIQRIQISQVIAQPVPASAPVPTNPGFRIHLDVKEVLAVFRDQGKSYAFPVGREENGNYHFMIDELLFIQDPHQLYQDWPAETWRAIAQHRVLPGMNETQVSFAIGVPESGTPPDDSGRRRLEYANHGHRVALTFANQKVVSIEP